MKVILAAKCVFPFHPVGGIQKYVYNLAKSLLKLGVDLEIVTPLDKGKPRSEIFEGMKYTFLRPSIYWYLEYPIGWLGVHLFSRSLAKYLEKSSFDILHSFDMTGYQYLKLPDRKLVIAQVFTDNYLSNPINFNNPAEALNLTASRFERIKEKKIVISPFADKAAQRKYFAQYYFKVKPMHYCLSQADCVFFEADIFRDEVRDVYKLSPKNKDVLPVGVDLDFIDRTMSEGFLSRREFGFSEDDIILITVNRLAADKGIDKILLALEGVIKKNPKVKLIIIGRGYQEKELYEIIAAKGLSHHVKHLKDIPEKDLYKFYKMSDLYISAFSFPGSSLSTSEAMACSLPILTTGQPWLVRNGENGLVLKDNDPQTIQAAILELIHENQLKRKGSVSRVIVEDYDWKKIAQTALEKYKNLIST